MIEGINETMLRRYVEMRHRVDSEAKPIQSLASLLAVLQYCGEDTLDIDPVALGFIHSSIELGILNIQEILDEFIYIVEARRVLEDNSTDKDEA